LAHLCTIYDRHGELPDRSIDVYEQIVGLLAYQWDEERGIKRSVELIGATRQKRERLLASLSLSLLLDGAVGEFTAWQFDKAVEKARIPLGLGLAEADKLADEIEAVTGLFSLVGRNKYEFAHLSLQEYLAAREAISNGRPAETLFPLFPNVLALVIAQASDPLLPLMDLADRVESSWPVVPRQTVLSQLFVLLQRLGAEGIQFNPSQETGFLLLLLTSYLDGLKDFPQAGALATEGLTQHQSAKESIRLALRASSTSGYRSGDLVFPLDLNRLPAPVHRAVAGPSGQRLIWFGRSRD
jgi:hypothetical protein